MLPKKNRLKRRGDFEKVLKKGKTLNEEYFYIKFRENGLGFLRVGFVVSKKVSNKATQRNKLKRRMREIIRKILPEMKKGLDVVIIAKKGACNLDFWRIKEILEKLLKKLAKNDSLRFI